MKNFKKYNDRINHLTDMVKDALELNEQDRKIKITNNSMNKQLGTFDDYQRSLNEKTIETLKSDIILNETFYIMSDLIRLSKQ